MAVYFEDHDQVPSVLYALWKLRQRTAALICWSSELQRANAYRRMEMDHCKSNLQEWTQPETAEVSSRTPAATKSADSPTV